jgi:hypothetical protein
MKLTEKSEVLKKPFTAIEKSGKRQRNNRKAKQILADIFGSSTAKAIISKAISKIGFEAGANVPNRVDIGKLHRKVTVTESAKFAGKTIELKRSVVQASTGSTATKAELTGLDLALSAIAGPQKMNTVTKSSLDWEGYKEGSGMGDELEQAAKDGFLSKKDFLERCDLRQFEMEKEVRIEKRSAAASST